MVLTNAMSQELTCPICLDVLKDTHVVKECMHRFCGVCITKALREGHFCPACRVHVSTRRSLRRGATPTLMHSSGASTQTWRSTSGSSTRSSRTKT
ncbi:unnamed protein product, partial [Phaeothamnion confervicola]